MGAGFEGLSVHWEVARQLLGLLPRSADANRFACAWFRATVALGQRREFFDTRHLRDGRRRCPDDPSLLLLAGAEREAMASRFFQAFARSMRRSAIRPDIGSASAELEAAEHHYRAALTRDPALHEARVRLGRVLIDRGRPGEAVAELRAALAASLDPVIEYRVRVDVLVTENGRPVTALSAADFEVRDNGVPQTIELVSLSDVGVSVVLAVDLSASVAGPRLPVLRRAGYTLIDALTPRDAAALVTFNRAAVLRVPLTSALDRVRAALAAAAAHGHTALIDATQAALLMAATDGSRNLVMIFSDGVDTASYTPAAVVVEAARRANGVVYAVSTSEEVTPFLRDVSSGTGGRVIEVDHDDDPGPAFLEVLREFRRRYVVTYTPTGVAAGGWHRLDVRVNRGNVRVRARPGYFSATP